MTDANDADDEFDEDEDLMREASPDILMELMTLMKGRAVVVRPWHAFRDPRVPSPTWRDAEPLIRLIRENADADRLSRDEAHYMIAKIVERLVVTRAREDPAFVRDEARRAQILQDFYLEDERGWDSFQQTPEYQRLAELWGARMLRASAEWLDELGEHEMARLIRVDMDEYEKRHAEGWSTFFGIPLSEAQSWNDPTVERAKVNDFWSR